MGSVEVLGDGEAESDAGVVEVRMGAAEGGVGVVRGRWTCHSHPPPAASVSVKADPRAKRRVRSGDGRWEACLMCQTLNDRVTVKGSVEERCVRWRCVCRVVVSSITALGFALTRILPLVFFPVRGANDAKGS